MGSVILVTGCSTGIGRESAIRLARKGAHVVATARNLPDIADLPTLDAPGSIEILELDVTQETQRRSVVAEVLAQHGRVDGLVNNAGYGVMTAVEDTDLDALRGMFETNVFGLHALTREVLPAMRRQRSGRIVNVGSIAGHLAIPLMGGYCATKFAVRALTEALHNEVRPFGIHAALVEPGVIRTSFGARSRRELRQAVDPGSSPYAAWYRRWERYRDGRGGAHPRVVAAAVVHACLDARPRFTTSPPCTPRRGTSPSGLSRTPRCTQGTGPGSASQVPRKGEAASLRRSLCWATRA